jgi:enoyl-CoA hydratase
MTTVSSGAMAENEKPMTDASELLFERRPPVALATLNRPKQLNALNHQVLVQLGELLDRVAGDEEIRALIITGSGERAFCAGADIGELEALETGRDGYEHSRDAHQVLFKMEHLDKPVIMAVNGYALGGGCELAMAGDIILASENASFGQPEVNLGIIPGFGGTQRLPRLIGRPQALELILTDERIPAQRALELGLINRVVPLSELLPKAEEIAQRIATKAPLAVALAKRAVYQGLELGQRAGSEQEMTFFGLAVGTDDRREGTKAFLEKRRPEWRGR